MLNSEKISLQVQQWLEEVVIGLGLCPFAGQPVAKGLHHIAVLDVQSIDSALAALRIECEKLMTADPKELETSLLILPYLFDDFLDFNDFMSEANNLLADNGWPGQLQLAGFHPRYQFFGTDPEAASNLTNCSPYPIIHILREDSVTWAVNSHPDIDAIPERNIAVMEALSVDQIAHLFPFR